MNTLIISYDLIRPGKDYTNLHKYIKSFNNWGKPLESFWIVKTSLSAEMVRNQTLQHVDANDKVIVIDVTNKITAWNNLSQDVSAWIKTNF